MITFLALGLPALMVAATGYGHPKPQQAVEPQTVHVVRPGESLSLLAKRYQVSVRALVEANSLVQPDHLRVGQRLVIPREAGSTPATRTVKRRSAQPLAPPCHFVLATSEFDGRAPVFGWPVEGPVSGTVGRTGRASAYHLHFEIRNNGKVYNPLHFLPALEVPPETGEATQPEEDDDDDAE